MHECDHCGKIYKQRAAYKKHIILCNISDVDMNKTKILPSNRAMWCLIQKMKEQLDSQQKKINTLENMVNRDIKKVNMLDWLNTNVKLSVNLEKWIKKIKVTIEDLQCIFDTTYTRGLYRIINNNSNDQEIPFKAFNHKSKQLYVYCKNTWEKATEKHTKDIFNKIQLEILKSKKDYDATLDKSEIHGNNNLQYLKNNEKILIYKPKIKDRLIKQIQNTIIDLVKINLNDMVKYQFYI